MVKQVKSGDEFKKMLAEAPGLVVVDFYAIWCGPCKIIAPYLDVLSQDYTDVLFIKVDVDDLEDVAADAGVTAMPTFKFYKSGKLVDEVVGASKEKILETIKKHA